MATTKKTDMNRLQGPQRHQLNTWVVENAEFVHAHTRKEIAARAEKSLGFKVLDTNAGSACRDTGIHSAIRAVKPKPAPKAPGRVDLAVLATALLEIDRAMESEGFKRPLSDNSIFYLRELAK